MVQKPENPEDWMKPFDFKQFTVHQDRCAMKIGTDGVLLGAWTPLENQPDSILDIGAGTGVVALMLAQRSTADTIDAVEVNGNAFEQCVENFEASPWADRLFCYHASFQEFFEDLNDDETRMDETYDLIVSNPPFYSEAISSGTLSRGQARQNGALPFEVLFKGVTKLLSKNGTFCLIIPKREEEQVILLAKDHSLAPARILRVRGNPSSPIKRSLMEFSFSEKPILETELTIEKQRHQYTEEYICLTQEFYLKM